MINTEGREKVKFSIQSSFAVIEGALIEVYCIIFMLYTI